MSEEIIYRALQDDEIAVMQEQGCSALDWGAVQVEEGFRPVRVRNTHFAGTVKIGLNSGMVSSAGGVEKISGIFNAYIVDCVIGRDVRIANIGVHLAHYAIGDRVCIENVGVMDTATGSTFGNGTEAATLNEGGGREVILFDELSVQYAYLMCLHRYRTEMITRLEQMARDYVENVRSDVGCVGAGATIRSVGEMMSVHIGAGAVIEGASTLSNGTVLSGEDMVTTVGRDVIAKNFIIAESSTVSDGAILKNSFVGQGCKMGQQYSCENSLFFANSEAFHGEACSIFAGPYTVTHHKSTLLIAGLYSFYNAGSGTNQSNHMYKLGPVHEGRLARGCKTGSFSYMMWPCCVGAFGVVLGKHTSTFDTTDYPFSHHEARPDGKCLMVPGLNLITVGTVRDGAKWPKRDRRQGAIKRDVLSFEVFSPYTVGKMIKASKALKALQEATDRSVEEVNVGGALVRRPILRTGQKFYRTGIEIYLLEKIFERLQHAIKDGMGAIETVLTSRDESAGEDWVDLGGLIMSPRRLSELVEKIESGKIDSPHAFQAAVEGIQAGYGEDEWEWIKAVSGEALGIDLDAVTIELITQWVEAYLKAKRKFLTLVIADAEKEFAENSRTGFGQDGGAAECLSDFEAVRGTCEANGFIIEMKEQIATLEKAVETFLSELKQS